MCKNKQLLLKPLNRDADRIIYLTFVPELHRLCFHYLHNMQVKIQCPLLHVRVVCKHVVNF